MANISAELQAILDAIYGEDVRGSIHDAIEKINDVSEVVLSCGTAVTSTSSSSSGFYDDSIYINTNTCDLWRCVGVNTWSLVGNLRGIGITSITLQSTTGLVDTYKITYSDGTTTTFDITNGRGITSIAKTGTSNNVDTYTITFNDGTTSSFNVTNGIDGVNGNKWYRGTDINGKQTNPTVFSGSGIAFARANDYYINPSEGAIYYCVLDGDPYTALWVYDFTLNGGGGGVSTWGELLKKPFNYVGGNGLEITGSTENDYTLQAKVDGSYVKTDSNGALTINPDVLKGVYKYNTADFRTDDTSKIVYLSNTVQEKLTAVASKIDNPSTKSSGQVLTYNSTTQKWEAQNPSGGTAAQTYYSNTTSGLTSTNVQGAIDEITEELSALEKWEDISDQTNFSSIVTDKSNLSVKKNSHLKRIRIIGSITVSSISATADSNNLKGFNNIPIPINDTPCTLFVKPGLINGYISASGNLVILVSTSHSNRNVYINVEYSYS